MIDVYLDKKVQHKRRIGEDEDYNGAVYADPVEIPARIEMFRRKTRNKQGEQITSEATITVKTFVDAGDILILPDGVEWPVINSREEQPLFGGVASHWEVYL